MTIEYPNNPNDRQKAAMRAVVRTAERYPDTITGNGRSGIGTLRALYRACGGQPNVSDQTLRDFAFESMKKAVSDAESAPQPAPQPEPEQPNMPEPNADAAQQLAQLFAQLGGGMSRDEVNRIVNDQMETVLELVRDQIDEARESVQVVKTEVTVTRPDESQLTITDAHPLMPLVLSTLNAGVWPALIGPAGTGKTYLFRQVCEARGVDGVIQGALDDPFPLVGYMDAQGKYQPGSLYRAMSNGCGILMDELDGYAPEAMVAVKAAIGGHGFTFPNGETLVPSDGFFIMGSANTYGNGADQQYVGRYPLDAAVKDEFAFLTLDYDESLELRLATARANDDHALASSWVRRVQQVRKLIREHNVQHVVSMRASIMGAAMLAQGVERDVVEEAIIWKGLGTDERAKLAA